jgi:hypothetical protein
VQKALQQLTGNFDPGHTLVIFVSNVLSTVCLRTSPLR